MIQLQAQLKKKTEKLNHFCKFLEDNELLGPGKSVQASAQKLSTHTLSDSDDSKENIAPC